MEGLDLGPYIIHYHTSSYMIVYILQYTSVYTSVVK